jgi:putative flippase GtrA
MAKSQIIKRELFIFLIIGSLTALIDFASYRCLILLSLTTNLAKTLGFLTGTIFSYSANRLWTFNRQNHSLKSLWRFVILYSCTLNANVLINYATLVLLIKKTSFATYIAFLVATAISAILNFIGMKFFVFKATF